jgi:hypothetical protein
MIENEKLIDILQVLLKIDDIEVLKCSIESIIENLKDTNDSRKIRRNK